MYNNKNKRRNSFEVEIQRGNNFNKQRSRVIDTGFGNPPDDLPPVEIYTGNRYSSTTSSQSSNNTTNTFDVELDIPGMNRGRRDKKLNKKSRNEKSSNAPSRWFDDLPEDDQTSDTSVSDNKKNPDKKNHDDDKEFLNGFLDAYSSDEYRKSPSAQRDLIIDNLFKIADIMSHYYDDRYNDIINEMNGILELMTSSSFLQNLKYAVRDEDVIRPEWDDNWYNVARLIGIVVTECRDNMRDDVIHSYIWDLLASSGMWGMDIEQIVNDSQVSKDLATELVIKIPVPKDNMTTADIKRYAPEFINAILAHLEDNIDVINADTQGKLFHYFFGEGVTGWKAIGQMLVTKETAGLSTTANLVYHEYEKMLLQKLDDYDLNEIRKVLKFVAKYREENPNDVILYDPNEVMKYDNIEKVLVNLASNDKDTANHLI